MTLYFLLERWYCYEFSQGQWELITWSSQVDTYVGFNFNLLNNLKIPTLPQIVRLIYASLIVILLQVPVGGSTSIVYSSLFISEKILFKIVCCVYPLIYQKHVFCGFKQTSFSLNMITDVIVSWWTWCQNRLTN